MVTPEDKSFILTRRMIVVLIIGVATLPFIGMKLAFEKDYEKRSSLFHLICYMDLDQDHEWYYIGATDSKAKLEWSRGGYLITYVALRKEGDGYKVGTLSMDDNATYFWPRYGDIRRDMGIQFREKDISRSAIEGMARFPGASANTASFMTSEMLVVTNRFLDTDYTWDRGSLYMQWGAERVLQ